MITLDYYDYCEFCEFNDEIDVLPQHAFESLIRQLNDLEELRTLQRGEGGDNA